MHPMAMFDTDNYRSRRRLGVGSTKIGEERRHSLIFSKVRWPSSSQTVGWLFLRRRKIGSHTSVNLAMKRLIYCNLPKKPLISLLVLKVGMSSMALIFYGSIFIPHSLMICPSNFPKVIPKMHFLGFNFNVNYMILSKNLFKADLPCLETSLSCRPHIPQHLYASCRGTE